jgi:hypothetical protein
MGVPLCVLRMWEQAIFQFSVGVMCFAAFNTATQIAEEIPNL